MGRALEAIESREITEETRDINFWYEFLIENTDTCQST